MDKKKSSRKLIILLVMYSAFTVSGIGQGIGIGDTDSIGRKQGVWKLNDTVHRMILVSNFKNDFLDGLTIQYDYDSINVYLFNYKNNMLNGFASYYYDSRLIEINVYENDTLTKILKFVTGRLWLEDDVKNGKIDGNHFIYDKNERIQVHSIYETGILKQRSDFRKRKYRIIIYDEQGRIVSNTGWVKKRKK